MKRLGTVHRLALCVSLLGIAITGIPARGAADDAGDVIGVIVKPAGTPASGTSSLQDNQFGHTLLRVPDGQTFFLTDVTVANLGPDQHDVRLAALNAQGLPGDNLYSVVVRPGRTFTQSFRTPIQFAVGVSASCGGCSATSAAIVTVTGTIR